MRTQTAPATQRVLRKGFPSPLTLPGYEDAHGNRVPYPNLTETESLRLIAALSEYKHDVVRICDARMKLLMPDLLCVAHAVVKNDG